MPQHEQLGVLGGGRAADQAAGGADGQLSRTALPRQERISFIPGAHPGYITRTRPAPHAATAGQDLAGHADSVHGQVGPAQQLNAGVVVTDEIPPMDSELAAHAGPEISPLPSAVPSMG
jgi:hypothetical protein